MSLCQGVTVVAVWKIGKDEFNLLEKKLRRLEVFKKTGALRDLPFVAYQWSLCPSCLKKPIISINAFELGAVELQRILHPELLQVWVFTLLLGSQCLGHEKMPNV